MSGHVGRLQLGKPDRNPRKASTRRPNGSENNAAVLLFARPAAEAISAATTPGKTGTSCTESAPTIVRPPWLGNVSGVPAVLRLHLHRLPMDLGLHQQPHADERDGNAIVAVDMWPAICRKPTATPRWSSPVDRSSNPISWSTAPPRCWMN